MGQAGGDRVGWAMGTRGGYRLQGEQHRAMDLLEGMGRWACGCWRCEHTCARGRSGEGLARGTERMVKAFVMGTRGPGGTTEVRANVSSRVELSLVVCLLGALVGVVRGLGNDRCFIAGL